VLLQIYKKKKQNIVFNYLQAKFEKQITWFSAASTVMVIMTGNEDVQRF
jgi:hypothetical protein